MSKLKVPKAELAEAQLGRVRPLPRTVTPKAATPRPKGAPVSTLPCPGLAKARKEAGYKSAEEAARALGVPGSRWRKWEERARAPRADLERAAKAWGVKLDVLTTATDERAEIMADLASLGTQLEAVSARVRRFISQRT